MLRVLRFISFILWLIRQILWLFMCLVSPWLNKNQKYKLPPIKNPILLQPVSVIAERIRQRQITAYEVVRIHIDRIQAIQPLLNVYIDERFDDALNQAKKIDQILDGDEPIPDEFNEINAPFLGVPFAIKESMKFIGFRNSTGIAERKDFIADETAKAVENMIKAGAVLLCNTNVSEGCMWFESYNTLYGITNNPYDLSRTVGGSSGGSGCIVSAAGVPFAIGSDIGGSIRLPAFMNGIFGHKTSPDIVPNDGQHPPHKDHHQKYLLATGPMCRYASDLSPMLRILAGPGNLTKLADIDIPVDLSKLRYFYVDDMDAYFVNNVDRNQKLAHLRVINHFEKKYNVHVTRLRLNRLRYPVLIWASMMVDGQTLSKDFSLILSDFKYSKNGFLELFRKCFRSSSHTFPSIALLILESIPNKYSPRFKQLAHKFHDEMQTLLGDDGILFFPSFPQSAPLHVWPTVMNTFDYIYCGIFNALGLPSTQCPLGLGSDGLPLGIQSVASRTHDRLTLAVAKEIEDSFGGWVSPSKKELK